MRRVLSATGVADLLGPFNRAPAYKGLAKGLRLLITDGRITVGTRLPSERELTSALDVSRTTVTRAYAEMRELGYLVSRQGAGSIAVLPDGPGARTDHLLPPGQQPTGMIDLTVAAGPPGPGVLGAYESALAALPTYLAGTGYTPSGLPVLREAVARWYDARGLPTTAAQLLIVPGALAGVAIAVRALLSIGDRVVLESPTYPNAIATLRAAGARLVGVDVAPDGAPGHARELASTIDQVAPRAAYLVPDFHNPTAALMSDSDRERVAHAMNATGTVAIVDESLSDLPLDGQPMPEPFAAHAPSTWSVGSLSKTHWGGLRVGWLRVPAGEVDRAFRARLSLDLGTAVLEQLAGTHLMGTGGLVDYRRDQLRRSRNAAYDALRQHLPDWGVPLPGGGLSMWCELPSPLSPALVPHAARHGVLLAAGPAFAPTGGMARYLRIPYGQPAHLLTQAVTLIGQAWRDTLAAPGATGRQPPPTLVT